MFSSGFLYVLTSNLFEETRLISCLPINIRETRVHLVELRSRDALLLERSRQSVKKFLIPEQFDKISSSLLVATPRSVTNYALSIN